MRSSPGSVDLEGQPTLKLVPSGAQSSGLIRHWRIDVFIVIPQMGMALRKAGFLMALLESPAKCKLLINSNLPRKAPAWHSICFIEGSITP
jgi:hypothetical protein